MSILSIPDYRGGNPYQSNLEEALDENVTYGRDGVAFPICRELLSGEVTLVHLHWFSAFFKGDSSLDTAKRFGLFVVWILLIRLRSIPVVWTVHNVQIHDSEYPRVERIVKRWFILNMCDRFIVHCDAIKEELVTEYDLPPSVQDRIDIIPHGHYLDNYENELEKAQARNSLDIPESSTLFLFFGKICPYKGIHSLIDAFQELSSGDRRLLVAGKPVTKSFGDTVYRRCNSDERIHHELRFIPDDEIQRYLNAADAVVLPYRNITTSGSAILAMSFGKAVVVPRLGCLPDLLDDEGAVLYDPEQPDALRTALEATAERDLEEMGNHNMTNVSKYDWDSIAEQTRETYTKAR